MLSKKQHCQASFSVSVRGDFSGRSWGERGGWKPPALSPLSWGIEFRGGRVVHVSPRSLVFFRRVFRLYGMGSVLRLHDQYPLTHKRTFLACLVRVYELRSAALIARMLSEGGG